MPLVDTPPKNVIATLHPQVDELLVGSHFGGLLFRNSYVQELEWEILCVCSHPKLAQSRSG
jgi:hypothetical protein